MKTVNDLSVCDKEPIHIPGFIQPHGYCCSFDIKTKKITSLSENISDAKSYIGKSIAELIPQELLEDLRYRAQSDEHEDIIYDVQIPKLGSESFDIAQMDSGDELIIEVHPRRSKQDYHECNYKLAHTIEKLSPSISIIQMCEQAAKEMKRISGFDRVMLYRFDPDYNGSVIAEEKEDDLGSYYGLHFPADDIPAPARELYRKQTVRIISDVNYKPVSLVRQDELDSLDMTYSQLRSVSPIHIEYLKNMNVEATLTVSILVEGKLWGLIACHHYKKRHLSLRHLELIRTFGIFFSGVIEAREGSHKERRTVELSSTLDTIIHSMQINNSQMGFKRLMDTHKSMFLSLFKADGFAFVNSEFVVENNFDSVSEDIKSVIEMLKPLLRNGFFHTHSLKMHLPDLDERLLARYSGVILVELNAKEKTYWFWYRKEKTQTLHWGGDPYNRMTIKDDGRIHPRKSFKAFKEVVRYRCDRWEAPEIEFMQKFIITIESFFDWLFSSKQVAIKENQIRQMESEKAEHYKQLLGSLVDMIEQRDAYTAGHTQRVALYSELIAKELGIDNEECQKLYEAAVLHDIGKLVVPDSILLKPGKLAHSEFELIKQHLNAGYEILRKIDYYKPLAEIIRYHHEKYDGTGYLGFKGEEIPISSHILLVADAIDAMTSNRIYQARKSMKEALEEIVDLKGKWYHPEVAEATYRALIDIGDDESKVSQMPLTPMEKARFFYYYKDQLTGVYNESYLKLILDGFAPEKGFGGYLMVEIKGMNEYNYENGWHAGDELIRSISDQIVKYVSSEDVFRVLGDDFIVGCESELECIDIMSKIHIDLNTNIKVDIKMVNENSIMDFIEERDKA